MKKVLFTATVDSHILNFHLPFLKFFKDNGYEVHVATNGDEQIPYCDYKHVISLERSPFKIKNIKAIFELKKICEKEKFDIIHTHTPMGSVVTRLAANKYRKKYGTRVIYTAHGFHFYSGAPLVNWLLYYPVEKYLAKKTDTMILINQEDYMLAKKNFSKKCKDIQYVPGVGINIDKFKNESNLIIRKQLGLSDKSFIMTCVARLDKNKNQSFLINVMELLKDENDIYLLLVGPDELNGYYQKIVSDKKLDDKVFFLGLRNDISVILNNSDIVVSSSLREGLPVNIMEAYACGKPVVALGCRGAKDLISNGENGFVVDINSDKKMIFFADYIKTLKNDKELYTKISTNNILKIQKYGINKIMFTMKQIYNIIEK